MRKFLLFSLLIFASITGNTQSRILYGYLKDSLSGKPVALASITNTVTKQTVVSNQEGRFRITVSAGHILSFAAVGYGFDTTLLGLDFKDTIYVRMQTLGRQLADVTVVANKKWSRYQLDSIHRRAEFLQAVGGDYKIPTFALSNSGAGLGFNIDRFSKHEKRKRKAFVFFEEQEQEAYINYYFTQEIVQQYTGLTDEKLHAFMQAHRPSYKWLRKFHTEEDLKYYLNDQLKIFFGRK